MIGMDEAVDLIAGLANLSAASVRERVTQNLIGDLAYTVRVLHDQIGAWHVLTDALGFGDGITEPAATPEQLLPYLKNAFRDSQDHQKCLDNYAEVVETREGFSIAADANRAEAEALRAAHEERERQVERALGPIMTALSRLPAWCRYHGKDVGRPDGSPCCETGEPSLRRREAVEAARTLRPVLDDNNGYCTCDGTDARINASCGVAAHRQSARAALDGEGDSA